MGQSYIDLIMLGLDEFEVTPRESCSPDYAYLALEMEPSSGDGGSAVSGFRVVGDALQHGALFRPHTESQRDTFVRFLNAMEYSQ